MRYQLPPVISFNCANTGDVRLWIAVSGQMGGSDMQRDQILRDQFGKHFSDNGDNTQIT